MSVQPVKANLASKDSPFLEALETPWNSRRNHNFQAYPKLGLPTDADARQLGIRHIFDIMPDAALLLDGDRRISGWNRAALTLLGCDGSDIVGREIDSFWKPESDERQPGGRWTAHGRSQAGIVLTKAGGTIAATLTIIDEVGAVVDRQKVAIISEISQSTDTERQIHQLQGELARLARLNELGVMAYTLAHELAQPLAVIANYAQGCVRRLSTNRDAVEEVRDVLAEITQQSLRASDTIRHLREFIARGGGEKKPEWMRDLIHDALKIALVGSGAAAISTEILLEAEHEVVLADRIQIEQVLMNLIRNAIEAMDSTPNPNLIIKTRNDAEGMVLVEVCDTGTGIAAEMEGMLFQPFVSSKASGLGIGLAISKRIIEAHGGRITGRRGPRNGSIFSFSLPLIGSRCNEK